MAVGPKTAKVKGSPTLRGFLFQRAGTAHLLEDRALCDWKSRAVVVADGVTRYAYGQHAGRESRRVGAVASTFCATAITTLKRASTVGIPSAVARVAEEATIRISALNRRYGLANRDAYLRRDPYGTVGLCGVLDNRCIWHFGYVGDLSLLLFRTNGAVCELSEDQLRSTRKLLNSRPFSTRQERFDFVRTKLRNRRGPRGADGNVCGYGVLNGDPDAQRYWHTGNIEVASGDILVICTDGGRPFVESGHFGAVLDGIRGNQSPALWRTICRKSWREFAGEALNSKRDDATVVVAQVVL